MRGARDDFEQRGFAGAVLADQAERLARGELEGDAPEGVERPVSRRTEEELAQPVEGAVVEAIDLGDGVRADRDAFGHRPSANSQRRQRKSAGASSTPYVQRRSRAMTSPPRISATVWVFRSPTVSFS